MLILTYLRVTREDSHFMSCINVHACNLLREGLELSIERNKNGTKLRCNNTVVGNQTTRHAQGVGDTGQLPGGTMLSADHVIV